MEGKTPKIIENSEGKQKIFPPFADVPTRVVIASEAISTFENLDNANALIYRCSHNSFRRRFRTGW
jgi:hypothetical protein